MNTTSLPDYSFNAGSVIWTNGWAAEGIKELHLTAVASIRTEVTTLLDEFKPIIPTLFDIDSYSQLRIIVQGLETHIYPTYNRGPSYYPDIVEDILLPPLARIYQEYGSKFQDNPVVLGMLDHLTYTVHKWFFATATEALVDGWSDMEIVPGYLLKTRAEYLSYAEILLTDKEKSLYEACEEQCVEKAIQSAFKRADSRTAYAIIFEKKDNFVLLLKLLPRKLGEFYWKLFHKGQTETYGKIMYQLPELQ